MKRSTKKSPATGGPAYSADWEAVVDAPRTPKQRMSGGKITGLGSSTWFRYYAGYSTAFAEDALRRLGLQDGAVVCDPWNGGGTTTQVATDLGILSRGYDINPAMVVVANARLLGHLVSPSELALAETIVSVSRGSSTSAIDDHAEPLEAWLQPATAAAVRSLERAVYRCLVDAGVNSTTDESASVSELSSLAAFYYVALFRMTGTLVASFRPSNPTWIRLDIPPQDRLAVDRLDIEARFRTEVAAMVSEAAMWTSVRTASDPVHARRQRVSQSAVIDAECSAPHRRIATLAVATSDALPDASGSLDAVLSSPPYCTRIDYAVATAPELAVLGIGGKALRDLRERMIGTAVIGQDPIELEMLWGPTCAEFLGRLASHSSKASGGYYLKTHLQYFHSLFRSLREIDRVLKPAAKCVLVVQDSFYKEIHNDLPRIVCEMGNSLGWNVHDEHRFPAKQLMAMVHTQSRSYRRDTSATEAVIEFETSA